VGFLQFHTIPISCHQQRGGIWGLTPMRVQLRTLPFQSLIQGASFVALFHSVLFLNYPFLKYRCATLFANLFERFFSHNPLANGSGSYSPFPFFAVLGLIQSF